jgi:hypothetical protein
MEANLPEVRLAVLGKITELLVELSDDGSPDFDANERRDYFSRVSDLIAEEIGLEIVDFDENGTAIGHFKPISGW